MRITVVLLVGILCGHIVSDGRAIAQENRDVTLVTPFAPFERPTVANFYYDGRAIGSGREAFQEILDHVAKLPAGTSIVWGPNYARCGACSGREPACLPKHLYPDLWKQLLEIVAERKLTLSSSYPGPSIEGSVNGGGFPTQVFAESPPQDQTFASVLDWEIDPKAKYRDRHVITSNSVVLDRFSLDLHLQKLPEGSRVLVRLKANVDDLRDADTQLKYANRVHGEWATAWGNHLRRSNLTASMVAPAVLVPSLKDLAEARQKVLSIDWKNFHGPGTPHNEVVYLVNGRYVGRGDAGVDQIISQIEKLESGWKVQLPHYRLTGRYATERFGRDELRGLNEELSNIVPFADRRKELIDKIISKTGEVVTGSKQGSPDGGTILSWSSGDRYAFKIASFGRIIYHDQTPKPTALKLSWTGYNAGQRRDRKLETSAHYTVNDEEVGEGVEGFAKAMQRVEALAEGSVIHVKVCLRTSGPFRCPLIYGGQRHFERTGFEPYFGMFDWLLDVAEKRKLEIEWLPDESVGCEDCELNK